MRTYNPCSLAALQRTRHLMVATLLLGLATSIHSTFATDAVDADRFLKHVAFLADDAQEGRGIGSDGLERSAQYIIDAFQSIGLKPGGDNSTFRQTFNMVTKRLDANASSLSFGEATGTLRFGKDFTPTDFSSDCSFDAPLVFAGYGIAAQDRGHDDYAHLNPQGSVVLVVRGEPPAWQEKTGSPTREATLRNKVYNAKDRGAVGILFVNREESADTPDTLDHIHEGSSDDFGIPALQITRAVANQLLEKGGAGTLNDRIAMIDKSTPASVPLNGIRVKGQAGFNKTQTPTSNIIGVLPGTGPLKDECIVIGAHYDHLGIVRPMSRTFKDGKIVAESLEPQIHNGADDNASGTSALIEAARALASMPDRNRSIVFIAFTAEESGLHGSKYYVEQPTFPMNKTVAMLNMDMVGRLDPKTRNLEVFGVGTGEGFSKIINDAADSLPIKIAPTDFGGGRSDHAPFLRHQVPALHFFSGQHADYHKPGDDTHTVNAEGGAVITQLVTRIASKLASSPTRLAYVEVKEKTVLGDADGPAPSYKVVMGLAPSYGDDGQPGMRVDAVNPDGPADLGGMKPGDRITRIADKPISNIYDYMASTRNNKPGDVVPVIVLRDGKEVTLKITLAGAR